MSDNGLGKYRIIAELGHGGMADVYLAVCRGPVGFSKLVVIKRLRPNLVDQPEFVTMLVDEARLAGRLNHPNVVQTNEVALFGDQYYIAMEYLEGQPLHRIIGRSTKKFGRIPFKMVARVLADSLSGLHYAHELKEFDGRPLEVVHRDATPQNIFVTYDGSVKVVDFGIAKAADRSSETRAGVIKGKVAFMAPEQASGQDVDRRADVFAVGVMLWEAATGTRMWASMRDIEILQKLIARDVPISPKAVNAAISDDLDRICRKALAPRMEDRYATAEEFRRELDAYLERSEHRCGNRELGEFVSGLFEDRREQTRDLIERELTKLRDSDTERSGPVTPESLSRMALPKLGTQGELAPASLRTSSPGISIPPSDGRGDSASRLTPSSSSGAIVSSVTPPPSRAGWKIAVAAGAVIAAGAGLWFAKLRNEPTPAPATAQGEITMTIRVSPPDAKIAIDDGDLTQNPYVGRFVKDSSSHRVRIEAPGYLTWRKEVQFSDNHNMEVSLEKEPVVPADSATAVRSSEPAVAKPKTARGPAPNAVTPKTPATTKAGGRRPPEIPKGDPWAD